MRKPTEAETNELIDLMTMAKAAREALGDALDSTADKCGVKKSSLRKYITAIFSDKKHESVEEVDELQALLSE